MPVVPCTYPHGQGVRRGRGHPRQREADPEPRGRQEGGRAHAVGHCEQGRTEVHGVCRRVSVFRGRSGAGALDSTVTWVR